MNLLLKVSRLLLKVLGWFGNSQTRIASNQSEDVFVLLLLNRLGTGCRQDVSLRNIVYND